MAYYSIYRIIKDIIKTIFGRKFWKITLIVFIAFTVFFIMGQKGVFALTFNSSGYSYYIDDSYLTDYYVICEATNGSYAVFFTSTEPMTYRGTGANGGMWSTTTAVNSSYMYQTSPGYSYNGVRYDFCLPPGRQPFLTPLSTGRFGSYNNNNYKVVASNYDVKNSGGTVVFQQNLNVYNSPEFYNKDNFIDFTNDSLVVYPNDYGILDTLYLHILTVDSSISDDVNTYYYYGNSILALNSDSDYFAHIDDTYYYNIPSRIFNLQAGKKYIFFLSDNSQGVNNSVGLYDYSDDFDGFILEPTSEQISPSDTIINNQQNQNNSINNIDNFLNNDNVDDNTNEDINNSLNKDTTTNGDTIVTSFFTRLTSIITDLADYNLQEDTEIVIPVPFTNDNIVLHSNYLYTYLTPAFKLIIEGFWYYLFGFYIFKFVNKIYISIKSGKILDGVSTSDEVITNDML